MTIAATHSVSSRLHVPAMLHQPGAALSIAKFDHDVLAAGAGSRTRDQVREAASQFVSSAFVLPVLNALRESPFNDGPFAPGPAERRFGPLLDQHLADEITSSANFSLIDSVVERSMRTTAASTAYGLDGASNATQ